jgi:hypothetical protein
VCGGSGGVQRGLLAHLNLADANRVAKPVQCLQNALQHSPVVNAHNFRDLHHSTSLDHHTAPALSPHHKADRTLSAQSNSTCSIENMLTGVSQVPRRRMGSIIRRPARHVNPLRCPNGENDPQAESWMYIRQSANQRLKRLVVCKTW